MGVDELRDIVWAYLYEAEGAHTVDEIAALIGRDRESIGEVVNHAWFHVVNDRVAIAYTSSTERLGSVEK